MICSFGFLLRTVCQCSTNARVNETQTCALILLLHKRSPSYYWSLASYSVATAPSFHITCPVSTIIVCTLCSVTRSPVQRSLYSPTNIAYTTDLRIYQIRLLQPISRRLPRLYIIFYVEPTLALVGCGKC